MNSCRIAFFGSSQYSLIPLKILLNHGYTISVIVSQPDRPKGRGRRLFPTPVAEFARQHDIPLITPASSKKNPLLLKNPDEFCQRLQSYQPTLLVLAAYGAIVPEQALSQTPYGGLNIHPSLLPKYRGAAPAQWAILAGEKQSGVTIIKMAAGIDTGGIVAQETEPIHANDTAPLLYQRLFKKGGQLLVKILPDYLAGKITATAQPSTTGIYARRLTRQDGFVPSNILKQAIMGKSDSALTSASTSTSGFPNFSELPNLPKKPAILIHRMLRAFTPWPGVWTKLKLQNKGKKLKDQRLKILKAHLEGEKLVIEQVQLAGKKPTSWEQFKKNFTENLLG